MNVFVSGIDTAKLYLQVFFGPKYPKIFINEPLVQCADLLKCQFIWIILWLVSYESLKTKEKSSWVISKVVGLLMGAVACQSFLFKGTG